MKRTNLILALAALAAMMLSSVSFAQTLTAAVRQTGSNVPLQGVKVDVILDTEGAAVTGFDAFLKYDKNNIQLIDAAQQYASGYYIDGIPSNNEYRKNGFVKQPFTAVGVQNAVADPDTGIITIKGRAAQDKPFNGNCVVATLYFEPQKDKFGAIKGEYALSAFAWSTEGSVTTVLGASGPVATKTKIAAVTLNAVVRRIKAATATEPGMVVADIVLDAQTESVSNVLAYLEFTSKTLSFINAVDPVTTSGLIYEPFIANTVTAEELSTPVSTGVIGKMVKLDFKGNGAQDAPKLVTRLFFFENAGQTADLAKDIAWVPAGTKVVKASGAAQVEVGTEVKTEVKTEDGAKDVALQSFLKVETAAALEPSAQSLKLFVYRTGTDPKTSQIKAVLYVKASGQMIYGVNAYVSFPPELVTPNGDTAINDSPTSYVAYQPRWLGGAGWTGEDKAIKTFTFDVNADKTISDLSQIALYSNAKGPIVTAVLDSKLAAIATAQIASKVLTYTLSPAAVAYPAANDYYVDANGNLKDLGEGRVLPNVDDVNRQTVVFDDLVGTATLDMVDSDGPTGGIEIKTKDSNGFYTLAAPAWLEFKNVKASDSARAFPYTLQGNDGPSRAAIIRMPNGLGTAYTSHEISQDNGCRFVLEPSKVTFDSQDVNYSFSVYAPNGACLRTAVAYSISDPKNPLIAGAANPSWVAVTDQDGLPLNGSPNNTFNRVYYTLEPNVSAQARYAAIYVYAIELGKDGAANPKYQFLDSHVVVQEGRCRFIASPSDLAFSAAGGTSETLALTITTTEKICAWQISAKPSWVALAPAAGTVVNAEGYVAGTGSYSVTAAANTGLVRSGEIVIATDNGEIRVPVAQAEGCSVAINPAAATVAAAAGTGKFAVTSSCAYVVAETEDWIEIVGVSNNEVNYAYSLNPGVKRVGSILVRIQGEAGAAAQVFKLTQDAATCQPVAAPAEVPVDAAGGTFTSKITFSNDPGAGSCRWIATSNQTWASILEGGQGTGDGVVTFAVDDTRDGQARQAVITVTSISDTGAQGNKAEIKINQSDSACGFVLCNQALNQSGKCDNSSLVISHKGGDGMLSVIFNNPFADCKWYASVEYVADEAATQTMTGDWLQIVEGGSGQGTGQITFTVDANAVAGPDSARFARIVVNCQSNIQKFAVKQMEGYFQLANFLLSEEDGIAIAYRQFLSNPAFEGVSAKEDVFEFSTIDNKRNSTAVVDFADPESVWYIDQQGQVFGNVVVSVSSDEDTYAAVVPIRGALKITKTITRSYTTDEFGSLLSNDVKVYSGTLKIAGSMKDKENKTNVSFSVTGSYNGKTMTDAETGELVEPTDDSFKTSLAINVTGKHSGSAKGVSSGWGLSPADVRIAKDSFKPANPKLIFWTSDLRVAELAGDDSTDQANGICKLTTRWYYPLKRDAGFYTLTGAMRQKSYKISSQGRLTIRYEKASLDTFDIFADEYNVKSLFDLSKEDAAAAAQGGLVVPASTLFNSPGAAVKYNVKYDKSSSALVTIK